MAMPVASCHTFWIATVHSRTTAASFERSRTFCLRLRPREHVISALIDLHWLPVAARIEFKICVLAYQLLDSTAPAYISDMLQPVSTLQLQINLRSATNSELFVPRTRLRVGERAFSSAALRLWNALPTDIKRAATLLKFKKKLKTFLFSKHLTSMLILLYFIIAFLVHMAYISTCITSWSSSHVSCIVYLD